MFRNLKNYFFLKASLIYYQENRKIVAGNIYIIWYLKAKIYIYISKFDRSIFEVLVLDASAQKKNSINLKIKSWNPIQELKNRSPWNRSIFPSTLVDFTNFLYILELFFFCYYQNHHLQMMRWWWLSHLRRSRRNLATTKTKCLWCNVRFII